MYVLGVCLYILAMIDDLIGDLDFVEDAPVESSTLLDRTQFRLLLATRVRFHTDILGYDHTTFTTFRVIYRAISPIVF